MAEYNPFAGLGIVTPDALKAQRAAENAEQTKGMDYWVQATGRAGLDFRNELLEKGKGMTAEDQRAVRSQSILEKAQKSISEAVKSGDVEPYDAQELAVSQAMTDFMSIGDYQAAQSLIPSLNQIRTYRAELQKLNAAAYKDTAAGHRSVALEGRIPFQNAADEAKARASDAAAESSRAHASLYNRTDPNLRAQPKGDSSATKIGTAAQGEYRAQITGTLNVLRYMDELSTTMSEAPRSASYVGAQANTANQYITGAMNVFASKGASVGGYENLSDSASAGAEGTSPKQIVANARRTKNWASMAKTARTLGMDVTQYESLVIDAAYSLARANDPGGRLSNNDFDYALKQLGAVQDARSAKAAFVAIARRAKSKLDNAMSGLKKEDRDELFSEQLGNVDAEYKAFTEKWGDEVSASPPRRTSAPAPAQNTQSLIDKYAD